MDRKLAAILAADVVGYSALMERDEAGTHQRLKAARKQLFEPEIARHRGRVFKLMGDGLLAEFASIVDAVECAVFLQRGLAERNAAVAEDQRVQVRIGINLGEVIIEGEDCYGEGVNIAARLEQLADPGGICVSGKVAKEVERKLAFGFESMGEQKVKNIADPVHTFRVTFDGCETKRIVPTRAPGNRKWAVALGILALAVVGAAAFVQPSLPWFSVASDEPGVLPLPGKPSLAVLPFNDLGGGDQVYFADGLTEDLITDLSKLSGIFVISRNSSWTYKDKPVKIQQVARDLGVRYVLEGSVRREGDTVRINAQLIDAQGGQHLWAERYDGSMKGVFALQDKVIDQIVAALAVTLTGDERSRLTVGETQNPEAYDAMIKGWNHYRKETAEDNLEAVALLETAIRLDPDFGRAHAALAAAYWQTAKSSWESATQGGFQRVARARLRQHRRSFERWRQSHVAAVAGDEDERHLHRMQLFRDGKTVAANEADVEQGEVRRAIGNQLQRAGRAGGGAHLLHAEAEEGVLEIQRNDRVIFDDQDIIRHALGIVGFHDLGSRLMKCPRRMPGGGRTATPSLEARGRFPA